MNARGVEMTIPMPGHAAGGEADTRENLELLVRLFKEHDVVYLLTDSRESRWLPTMLGMATGKVGGSEWHISYQIFC